MQFTPFGKEFYPEKFLRTPSQTIRRLLLLSENKQQHQLNSTSVSASYVCNYLIQIAHSYSGSKKSPPRTKPQDFLPYPAWEPLEGDRSSDDRPTEITRSILKTLLIKRNLPIHVFIALNSKTKDTS